VNCFNLQQLGRTFLSVLLQARAVFYNLQNRTAKEHESVETSLLAGSIYTICYVCKTSFHTYNQESGKIYLFISNIPAVLHTSVASDVQLLQIQICYCKAERSHCVSQKVHRQNMSY